jgi:Arc/MetJ family transcription regulator
MEQTFVKKTMFVNKGYLKKAVRILNTKTEKEAVNKALELVVEEDDIIETHKAIGGTEALRRIYR